MSADSDALRRVLSDILSLLGEAEHCPTCEGPSSALDEACRHHKKWEELRKRAKFLLNAAAKAPN